MTFWDGVGVMVCSVVVSSVCLMGWALIVIQRRRARAIAALDAGESSGVANDLTGWDEA